MHWATGEPYRLKVNVNVNPQLEQLNREWEKKERVFVKLWRINIFIGKDSLCVAWVLFKEDQAAKTAEGESRSNCKANTEYLCDTSGLAFIFGYLCVRFPRLRCVMHGKYWQCFVLILFLGKFVFKKIFVSVNRFFFGNSSWSFQVLKSLIADFV